MKFAQVRGSACWLGRALGQNKQYCTQHEALDGRVMLGRDSTEMIARRHRLINLEFTRSVVVVVVTIIIIMVIIIIVWRPVDKPGIDSEGCLALLQTQKHMGLIMQQIGPK